MWVMFLLLSNPFSQSRCYIQCWTWPLSSEPVPSPGLVSGELGNEPAHLKHITSDISRGGKEGLLARKQGGFWLLETKFSNSTLLAESQPSSKQLSHGLQKKKKKNQIQNLRPLLYMLTPQPLRDGSPFWGQRQILEEGRDYNILLKIL